MRVEVRLYATFAEAAPTQRAGDPFNIELAATASLNDLICSLGLPKAEVHLAIVNGRIIHDRTHLLCENDRVGLFPPVGGG